MISTQLKTDHMKKMIFLLLSITLSGAWLAWKAETSSRKIPNSADIISCMESEAVQEYIRESGEWSFAALHPSPKSLENWMAQGKRITFPAADGKDAQGYYVAPRKKSNKWLIVIQEWWGLNEQIMAEADKYAAELGDFHVLAVDLYDGKVAATPDSAMKYSRGSDPARMATIIKAAISNAGKNAGIYSVGWCFGGMWSLQTAILAGSQAKGTIMFYGRPETDLEKLKSIQCDVIGFFGNLDKSPSPEMVTAFEKNMADAGKKLETHKYEAGHGFANPSNPRHNPEATADSYSKAISFLKSH